MIEKLQLGFNIVVTLTTIVFTFWWSSRGFLNSIIKTFFLILAIAGVIILLPEMINLLK